MPACRQTTPARRDLLARRQVVFPLATAALAAVYWRHRTCLPVRPAYRQAGRERLTAERQARRDSVRQKRASRSRRHGMGAWNTGTWTMARREPALPSTSLGQNRLPGKPDRPKNDGK